MNPMIRGLHHVTALASDPQRNVDFYAGTLGLRLVKRTVNFDDPGTYHFYFGDAAGSPGTILTFFPWPNARRGQRGTGEVEATSFRIPAGSLEFWLQRLRSQRVPAERMPVRFGEEAIRLADPDGMIVELVPSAAAGEVIPAPGEIIPAAHAIRGFHGVSATLREIGPTLRLLTEVFGYRLGGESGDRTRLVSADAAAAGNIMDLIARPDGPRGRQSAGSVHHIAFRVADMADQAAWRERLLELGFHVSEVMDRSYFHSIYFREPGGILFELATDGPGFATDEPAGELGTRLSLPPWLEGERAAIEASLPVIHNRSTHLA